MENIINELLADYRQLIQKVVGCGAYKINVNSQGLDRTQTEETAQLDTLTQAGIISSRPFQWHKNRNIDMVYEPTKLAYELLGKSVL